MSNEDQLAASLQTLLGIDDLARIWPEVYPQLKTIARQRLRSLRPGQTLSTTVLVHELYMKLMNHDQLKINGLNHLMALSSKVMRHILVDYARQKQADKRVQDAVTLHEEWHEIGGDGKDQLFHLDDALTALEAVDSRLVFVVECRVFGGLQNDEIAHALNVSSRTVERDWKKAKMLLYQQIKNKLGETGDRGGDS